MRLLDLYAGGGGAAVGYHRAGFDEIVGVDCRPMPRYPFTFVRADALEYLSLHGHEFDAVHASPPCQMYSHIRRNLHPEKEHPDLVRPVREALVACGRPYAIENVMGSPLRNAVLLCGSMFGLDVRRHRLFECSFLALTPPCRHGRQKPRFRSLDRRQKTLACVVGVHGSTNYAGELEIRKAAMGIDWMSRRELSQAVPPAYTHHLGLQLLRVCREEAAP